MRKKIILMAMGMSLLISPVKASAVTSEQVKVSEDLASTYNSSIPTAYFNREFGQMTLYGNSSAYSKYIIYGSTDYFSVYLTTDPNSPDFVLSVEMIDCKTNKVVDKGMLMMFQQSTPNHYGIDFKKESPDQQCYFKFSNLSDVKGTFEYQLYSSN